MLTEATWSRPEVYDSSEKLTKTQWATHYTYVKSKVEQEKAAVAFAAEHGLDLRVVVPGNLCVGPIASKEINGTMTRLKDIVSGTNTLKGAADLAIVHVNDVVEAHAKCMTDDAAKGRYLVAGDMVQIEEVFSSLKQSTRSSTSPRSRSRTSPRASPAPRARSTRRARRRSSGCSSSRSRRRSRTRSTR